MLPIFSFALLFGVIPSASALTCDEYCVSLNGAGSLCSASACSRGRQYCGRPKCTRRTATTAAPTAATTTATTAKPVTTTVAPTVAPANLAAAGSPLFVWAEWPSGLSTAAPATLFFTGLVNFVKSNALGSAIPRIVMRILHPEFPALEGGTGQFFSADTSSLLYTSFLSKLPAGTELILYPYVMEKLAGQSWMSSTGAADPVQGAAAYMVKWNSVLSEAGSSVRFAGLVIDLEEMPGLATFSNFKVTAASVAALKAQYGPFEFGVSPGFDQTGLIQTNIAFVDKFYIQLYDFYFPTAGVDATPNSPFLLYKDQPQAMGDFVLTKALTAAQLALYQQYPSKIMAMWSNQNLAGSCLYPLPSGMCGANNEFGSWSAASMTAFITYIKSKSPAMASLSHGLFQYSFTPTSWV